VTHLLACLDQGIEAFRGAWKSVLSVVHHAKLVENHAIIPDHYQGEKTWLGMKFS
jgi:hypothetical protein